MKKYMIVCLAAVVLAACNSNPQVAALLSTADSLLTVKHDSALHLLETCGGEPDAWGKSQRMRYHLLLADAQNKCYVDIRIHSKSGASD